jgi:hypothetical protein
MRRLMCVLILSGLTLLTAGCLSSADTDKGRKDGSDLVSQLNRTSDPTAHREIILKALCAARTAHAGDPNDDYLKGFTPKAEELYNSHVIPHQSITDKRPLSTLAAEHCPLPKKK